MCIKNRMLTHNNTSVMTSLSFIPLSNASFSYKLIDEWIDDQGCNRLQKQSQEEDEYLEFGKWGPFNLWTCRGSVGVNIWISIIFCRRWFLVYHCSSFQKKVFKVEQFLGRGKSVSYLYQGCGIDIYYSWRYLNSSLIIYVILVPIRAVQIHLVYRGVWRKDEIPCRPVTFIQWVVSEARSCNKEKSLLIQDCWNVEILHSQKGWGEV